MNGKKSDKFWITVGVPWDVLGMLNLGERRHPAASAKKAKAPPPAKARTQRLAAYLKSLKTSKRN